MTDPITIRAALDLRPEDAIRAFRQRDELAISVSYRDLEPEEHARAFTAAKIAKLDILAALGGSLDTALKEGQTFQQWRDGILPTLQREGWLGLVQNEELTGTSRPVFVGERRLRTIFGTNMRVSRAAGQWARIQALKDSRPFLRYSAVLDNRTRPLHARWHGIIRPVDDPIWQTIYPPNGWNCRCQVQQLSQRDMDRRGYRVTPDGDLPDLGPTGSAWFGVPRQRRDVIRGIDAGWDYNPGAQSFAGLVARAAEVLAKAEAAGLNLAAAEVRDAIVAELEAVLGRTLALALLAQLAPAAVQIEAAARRGRKGGKAKGGGGRTGGVTAQTRAKLSKVAKDRNRDGQGRFEDEAYTMADVGRIGRAARADHTLQRTHDLGPLDRSNIESVQRAVGIDLGGFRRRLRDDLARHAFKSHGLSETEQKRGQVPIRERDLDHLPAIVNRPDSVSIVIREHRADRENPALEYVKTIGDRRFAYRESMEGEAARVEFRSFRAYEAKGKAR